MHVHRSGVGLVVDGALDLRPGPKVNCAEQRRRALLKSYPELSITELDFRLIEAQGRILPEVSADTGRWVVRSLEK